MRACLSVCPVINVETWYDTTHPSYRDTNWENTWCETAGVLGLNVKFNHQVNYYFSYFLMWLNCMFSKEWQYYQADLWCITSVVAELRVLIKKWVVFLTSNMESQAVIWLCREAMFWLSLMSGMSTIRESTTFIINPSTYIIPSIHLISYSLNLWDLAFKVGGDWPELNGFAWGLLAFLNKRWF